MKKRNTKQYRKLIEWLKTLRAQKKREDYKKLFKRICKDYNISEKTVYRDLHKANPGVRKPRSDQGKERKKVPKKIIDKIYENMKSGKTQTEAIKLAGHISSKKAAKILIDKEPEESSYGDKIKELIKKVYNADKISLPVKVKINNVRVQLMPEEINDIMMIIATAYNRTVEDSDKMQVDRLQLAKSKLYYLLDEQIRIAQQQYDLKAIETLSRIYDRLKETDREYDTDFNTVVKCMRELKPDITISEIIALIKKHNDT